MYYDEQSRDLMKHFCIACAYNNNMLSLFGLLYVTTGNIIRYETKKIVLTLTERLSFLETKR